MAFTLVVNRFSFWSLNLPKKVLKSPGKVLKIFEGWEPWNSHKNKKVKKIFFFTNNSFYFPNYFFLGIRLFKIDLGTDADEASAFFPGEENSKKVDIFSNSWGPLDAGATIGAPKRLAAAALEKGIKTVGAKMINGFIRCSIQFLKNEMFGFFLVELLRRYGVYKWPSVPS